MKNANHGVKYGREVCSYGFLRLFSAHDLWICFKGRSEGQKTSGNDVRRTIKHGGAAEAIDCIGARVASVRYFLPFGRCRVGVNWQSEKRLSLEGSVMHRRATEARRTQRSSPFPLWASKSKRKNTRAKVDREQRQSTRKTKRRSHGTKGSEGKEDDQGDEIKRGTETEIEA